MKYSETSIIADAIYEEREGMRSYIISGVRSSKAKIKAKPAADHVIGGNGSF